MRPSSEMGSLMHATWVLLASAIICRRWHPNRIFLRQRDRAALERLTRVRRSFEPLLTIQASAARARRGVKQAIFYIMVVPLGPFHCMSLLPDCCSWTRLTHLIGNAFESKQESIRRTGSCSSGRHCLQRERFCCFRGVERAEKRPQKMFRGKDNP
jgi:hypothetical protein